MAKFCSNCGNELKEKDEFCPKCGTAQNGQPTQQAQPTYQQPNNGGQYPNQKSKMAAGLLGIFLGSFGVHNFYLGYTGKAIAQLLITLLTCGVGATISGIWGLIEGILILTGSINVDANGVPLGD